MLEQECRVVEVSGTTVDGMYELMTSSCNDNPVWKRSNEEAYIYQGSWQSSNYWELSPEFCSNSWMTSCQGFDSNPTWNCNDHPLNTEGVTDHTLKMPWEENFWVNNWWQTVQMSCVEWADISGTFSTIYFVLTSIFIYDNI